MTSAQSLTSEKFKAFFLEHFGKEQSLAEKLVYRTP